MGAGIRATIEADIKTAMKAREQERLLTLRGLLSEIKRVEIDTRTTLTDEQISSIFQKEIKKRRDALTYAEQGKRDDLIAQNKAEIALIQSYLGEQYSEDKLRELIGSIISSGADNVGKIMGALNKDHKGKFEGKVASELAKSMLK